MVTSQWIDPRYEASVTENELCVVGSLQRMASTTSFTPMKMALFHAMLSTVGRSARASHLIKGSIRRVLMLGTRAVPLRFRRRIRIQPGAVTVSDQLKRVGKVQLSALQFGDEFAVRYVPQSRFFQFPELATRGYRLSPAELAGFEATGQVSVTRRIDLDSGELAVWVGERPVAAHAELVGSGAAAYLERP